MPYGKGVEIFANFYSCLCRLGLTDFLRGKLVERLKEEEKKQSV